MKVLNGIQWLVIVIAILGIGLIIVGYIQIAIDQEAKTTAQIGWLITMPSALLLVALERLEKSILKNAKSVSRKENTP